MSQTPHTLRSSSKKGDALTQAERALALLDKTPLLRARDLVDAGIARERLRRLVQSGKLEQPDRGLYRRVGVEMAAEASIAEVARRTPHAVVALLSALRSHGLAT